MAKRKRLGLAGLAFGGAMSILSPNLTYAENCNNPEIIATFQYDSHREGYEGKSPFLTYHIWSDNTISRVGSDERFSQKWFWDIDGDGKMGDAEIDAIKSGKLIYMHPEFNKVVNEKIKEIFGYLINEKEKSAQTARLKKEQYKEPMRIPEEQKKIGRHKRKQEPNIGFSVGGRIGPEMAGGEVGINFGKWFALSGQYTAGKNESILDITTNPSPTGRYFRGTENNTDFLGIGVSAEAHLGPFIFGAGPTFWRFQKNTLAQMLNSNDEILASNSNSEALSKVSGNFYGGFEAGPVGKSKAGLGFTIGYDTRKGVYLGTRVSYPYNKYNRNKK